MVAEELRLGRTPPSPDLVDVSRIVGTYGLEIGENHTKVEIREDGGRIVIENHPFSKFGGADDPIVAIHDGRGSLILRSAPIELRVIPPTGPARRIDQVHWNDTDGTSRFAGTYTRIDD